MGWRIDQELKRENKRKSTMSVEGSDDEIAEEYGFPDK
jgi:hypothetical protein